MRYYKEEWLDSCPVEFAPKLYKKYVDDIFVMFQSRYHLKQFVDYMNTNIMFQYRYHVKQFVDYMNTKHPNIRFTFEIEDQNIFPFLDIRVIRNTEETFFEISVYRKSTFS